MEFLKRIFFTYDIDGVCLSYLLLKFLQLVDQYLMICYYFMFTHVESTIGMVLRECPLYDSEMVPCIAICLAPVLSGINFHVVVDTRGGSGELYFDHQSKC